MAQRETLAIPSLIRMFGSVITATAISIGLATTILAAPTFGNGTNPEISRRYVNSGKGVYAQ